MRWRWKWVALVVVAAICALLVLNRKPAVQRDLEATRRVLRREGFKVDLADFDLSVSAEQSNRAAILGTTTRAEFTNRSRPGPIALDFPVLVVPAAKDAALVFWQEEHLTLYQREDLWRVFKDLFETNRARLEQAALASLSGPIRFEPIGSKSPNALLPYLADIKGLEQALGMRAMLALHDGKHATARTNLLAATCLVTSYSPEPVTVSHMVRFACARLAFNAIWNALQSTNWTETELAELQQPWEAADFWKGLPDTAAYARADIVGSIQLERKQPISGRITLREIFDSPQSARNVFDNALRQLEYRRRGSFEDEKGLLLYYRQREQDLHRAVKAKTWAEMRQLPGVTNAVAFASTNTSRVQSMLNMRQMGLTMSGRGKGLLGGAAEAETDRRLITTAIALERYRLRHGAYPASLRELVPEVLASLPLDFMDGQLLRYRPSESHFVLYSVGLDCNDDDGKMRAPRQPWESSYYGASEFGPQQGFDLVWPRPATLMEAERVHREERSQVPQGQ